jgi:AraC-like DNA-binding protein
MNLRQSALGFRRESIKHLPVMLDPKTFARLCSARDALSRITDRPPVLEQVAGEAGMSLFHFIRTFSAVFGTTPHQYRIQARINRAKQRLVLGNDSVTDICLEVGLSSLGSFSDLFTRRVGVPPSSFRCRGRSMVTVSETLPIPLFPGCMSLMGPAFAILEKRR